MKRLAIKLVLFLVLGAIVNVGVAWGSVWLARAPSSQSLHSQSAMHWNGWSLTMNESTDPFFAYVATRYQTLTAMRLSMARLQGYRGAVWDGNESLDTICPTWTANFLAIPGLHGFTGAEFAECGRNSHFLADARGWPSLALWGGVRTTDAARFQERVERYWAIAITDASRIEGRTLWSEAIIPLKPIWPGFAINTVFYAAVLWLLFAAPGMVRRIRRRRRGKCVHCSYDLRGQPSPPQEESIKCPECGRSSPLRFRVRGRGPGTG